MPIIREPYSSNWTRDVNETYDLREENAYLRGRIDELNQQLDNANGDIIFVENFINLEIFTIFVENFCDLIKIIDILEDSNPNEKTFKDILEESESKVNASYPNEAYTDLIILVTKHKLSNTTGNAIIKFFNKHTNFSALSFPKSIKKGCKYIDNMDLSNLTYVKTCIMNYNNNEYYLHHLSLINCIDEKRTYSKQNTGTWWENTKKSILNSLKLLSIILYSDATNVDTLGKSQLHPIYVSIGNIKNWRRNKPDAKHTIIINVTLNNERIQFYPQILVVIADWPEVAMYCLTYKSSMSNLPCYFCLVKRDNLANINLQDDEIIPQTHNNMHQIFE
ncbi:hypothetical protein C1646_764944 [Rhizophagus diaphanus]|nr:hypothetical protein C1646_764944 [Rhizophagus diaphanus] [Rhizophagus sp. MUCL 43196]